MNRMLLHEILGCFPEPLILYDKDWETVFANGPAIDSLGFDPRGLQRSELRKRTEVHNATASEDAAEDKPEIIYSGKMQERKSFLHFRNAGGEMRSTVASYAPVLYEGERVGTIVTWLDITELIERENVVMMARDSLEQLLVERTCDLLESRELLERRDRLSELGTMAATIAHELRNPLGVMRTALFNIRRKNDNPALERHIANIDKKIEESSMIISNILNYSRINKPEKKPFRLATILIDCISSAKKRYRKSPVKITRDLRKIGGLEITADEGQIREVFLNILNNAVESIEEKGTVTVKASHDPGKQALVEISDDGIGISESSLENIFDPFYSEKAKGTGLGLAVCLKLIDLHGGSIGVSSRPGKGTRVSVTLPLNGE
jgi:signal transduction histidine kinase